MYISVDSEGLARLVRDLRRGGHQQSVRDLQKSLRRHLTPLVPEVRAAIRATPSAGWDRTQRSIQARPRGLRDAEARGVQVQASLTARAAKVGIRIKPHHFPEGSKSLVAYREGVKRPHRAPNWGRDEWHVQTPRPAFYPTIRPRIPAIQRAVEADIVALVNRLVGDEL